MRESCHRILLPRCVYPIEGELMNVYSHIIDPVILVAMRSKLLPSHGAAQALQNAVDLGLTMDINQPQLLDSNLSHEWELWGEEQTISLCEIRIEYKPGTKREFQHPRCER